MIETLHSFRETKNFTDRLLELLTDDEYAGVQFQMIKNPTGGVLIKGGGGIRKLRVRIKGKGKRGGARLIYYFATLNEEFFMLDIYSKNEKEDLSPFELKYLRNLVKEWLEE